MTRQPNYLPSFGKEDAHVGIAEVVGFGDLAVARGKATAVLEEEHRDGVTGYLLSVWVIHVELCACVS